jgi:nicotinamide-nucleotide amidase
MFAEIITIGDELLIGQVVDTNSAWMGQRLNSVGVEVLRIVSVRDRATEIRDAVDAAMRRTPLVLMTGGLGPTRDDITKAVLCDYFGTPLVRNDAVYRQVEALLRGRAAMNKLNEGQAMVPQSAVILPNRVGTAPVMWFEAHGSVLISMPGVPQEMKIAMDEQVIPRIRARFATSAIVHRHFRVRNNPESMLAERLETWESGLPATIKLAYLPVPGYIRLRLTARGTDAAALSAALDTESAKLHTVVGDDITDETDAPVEIMLGQALRAAHLTLATAESCTGGSIAARITSVAGASDYFKGSVVAYSNDIKAALLHVALPTLATHGAVSEQTVVEMARGAQRALNVDCAVAVSGIAGPSGGTPDKPVGTVWMAAACGETLRTFCQTSDRGREMNVERAVNNALMLLYGLLLDTTLR